MDTLNPTFSLFVMNGPEVKYDREGLQVDPGEVIESSTGHQRREALTLVDKLRAVWGDDIIVDMMPVSQSAVDARDDVADFNVYVPVPGKPKGTKERLRFALEPGCNSVILRCFEGGWRWELTIYHDAQLHEVIAHLREWRWTGKPTPREPVEVKTTAHRCPLTELHSHHSMPQWIPAAEIHITKGKAITGHDGSLRGLYHDPNPDDHAFPYEDIAFPSARERSRPSPTYLPTGDYLAERLAVMKRIREIGRTRLAYTQGSKLASQLYDTLGLAASAMTRKQFVAEYTTPTLWPDQLTE